MHSDAQEVLFSSPQHSRPGKNVSRGKCNEDEAVEAEKGPQTCRELTVASPGSKRTICSFPFGGHSSPI